MKNIEFMHTVIVSTASLALACCLLACGPAATNRQAENQDAQAKREKHRPQFHFTPPGMWMNDPNGMFFLDGEYHLFYQHYPDSTVWGPMHWGHAVSRDLVHWQHLPIALYPDSLGYIFSGSAVVDRQNTSGFGRNGQAPVVAVFTYHDMDAEKAGRTDYQYQGIAYSNDKGRSWTKYPGNPVLPNPGGIRDFRDPKVIWHEPSGQWIMVLAVQDHVEFWGSKDFKTWSALGQFGRENGAHGGVWECPDLFPLKAADSGETKWVLLVSINPGAPNGGSGTQYFIGDFDGKTFTPDETPTGEAALWLDHGRDNYAGVTWSDVPESDGRRLFIGWMSNWDYATVVPTGSWRSAMTLPRTLELKKVGGVYRLFSWPVRELQTLRNKTVALAATDIRDSLPLRLPAGFSPAQLELALEFEPLDAAADFGIELSNDKGQRYRIGYNGSARAYYSDRTSSGATGFSPKFAIRPHSAPRLSDDKLVRMHVFFDVASAELFADEGVTALTDIFFPGEDFKQVKIYVEKGTVRLLKGNAYGLRGAGVGDHTE